MSDADRARSWSIDWKTINRSAMPISQSSFTQHCGQNLSLGWIQTLIFFASLFAPWRALNFPIRRMGRIYSNAKHSWEMEHNSLETIDRSVVFTSQLPLAHYWGQVLTLLRLLPLHSLHTKVRAEPFNKKY